MLDNASLAAHPQPVPSTAAMQESVNTHADLGAWLFQVKMWLFKYQNAHPWDSSSSQRVVREPSSLERDTREQMCELEVSQGFLHLTYEFN